MDLSLTTTIMCIVQSLTITTNSFISLLNHMIFYLSMIKKSTEIYIYIYEKKTIEIFTMNEKTIEIFTFLICDLTTEREEQKNVIRSGKTIFSQIFSNLSKICQNIYGNMEFSLKNLRKRQFAEICINFFKKRPKNLFQYFIFCLALIMPY